MDKQMAAHVRAPEPNRSTLFRIAE